MLINANYLILLCLSLLNTNLTKKGFIQPVTTGFAAAMATFSFWRWMGRIIKDNATNEIPP